MIEEVLAWENLIDAWNDVQAGPGTPGIDGISVARWGRTWEERLVNLRRQVMANTYKPAPLKRFTIPKSSGGVRHLACLTVTDKVLQRALLNVLDALYDPLFLSCSYGYRKGHSTGDAVDAICRYRDLGCLWVLDADIDECFDSFDHQVVMDLLCQRVDDPIVLRLIAAWLRVGRRDQDVARGIPLGAVISPLLCNVCLHQLDLALVRAGNHVVRYADDFVVLCFTKEETQQSRRVAAEVLTHLHLQLEPHKTELTHFDAGFDYLGIHFEGDNYTYTWGDKRITVEGDFPDFLFAYGPSYE